MGFEAAGQQTRFSRPVTATGRKLSEVLDELIRADDRYEWREDDGVIVVRPSAAWRDPLSVFNTTVGPIRHQEMRASDAAVLIAQLFGVRSDLSSGPYDTIKFTVASFARRGYAESRVVYIAGVVRPAGLEPATSDLEGRCSIHLSYGRLK